MAGLKSEYGEMDLEDFGTETNNPNPTVSKEAVVPLSNVAARKISVETSTIGDSTAQVLNK